MDAIFALLSAFILPGTFPSERVPGQHIHPPRTEHEEVHSLYVHLEAGGDVRGVQQVPAAVEAFGVGVGATVDRGLPRRS